MTCWRPAYFFFEL